MMRDRRFWLVTIFASIVIHAIFCVQAYEAAHEGGLIGDGVSMFCFFPHAMLMYFLPPAYPIDQTGGIISVNWVGFAGKLLDAYPASLFYGWILGLLWCSIFRRRVA
jgi:hypothetical protein